ncbi:MAG TPA: hypothetical protein VMG58_07610, partial [Candidatus Sulfotelmatobacter sp.]|nr:hypothetical protein [Candidatus Sulfotelmatobacter sp.]
MTKDASSPIGWRSPALHRLLWLAVVLGGLMLSARLGSVGLWLKYDHALVPFLVGGITWAIFQCPRPTHASRLLAFGLLLHCAVLFATWQAGVTDGQLVAGLFPYSDARGYFLD